MPQRRSFKITRGVEPSKMFLEFFQTELTSDMDVISLSKQGVSKRSLLALGEWFGFSADRLAYMLPITVRTIQRYKQTQKFSPVVSEHIIQLARLMIRGTEVFESRDNFLRWFTTPNTAFGGKVPNELVSLQTGTQLVLDELTRIDHGVFA